MKPVRVQLRRTKGWRMPPNTLKVDRTTRWGNPFIVGVDGDAGECVALYRPYAAEGLPGLGQGYDPKQLRGKNLACWCPLDQPCHADVLLELANAAKPGEPNRYIGEPRYDERKWA
jgi:hypothetical protein